MEIRLSGIALGRLKRPVRGRGGFQSLLRKLQDQLDGDVLRLEPADVERLIRYTLEYGTGGFQNRTGPVVRRRPRRQRR
jgi:hypothetical protein